MRPENTGFSDTSPPVQPATAASDFYAGMQVHKTKKDACCLFGSGCSRHLPYSIRHAYIAMRLMEGVSIYQLSSNVGTSIEMIENYYGHLRNRDPNVVSEITETSFTDKPSSKFHFLYE